MTRHFLKIEVEDGKIKGILDRLQKAQEEIYKCYSELEAAGVLRITSKEKGGDSPAQE